LFIVSILVDLFENSLFVSLQIGDPLFFLTPISLFLIILIIAFFAYAPAKNMFKAQIKTGGPKT